MCPQTEEYNAQGKELREHGSQAFPAAWYQGDWDSISVPLHWHREMEAGFVTRGQVLLTVGREHCLIREGEGFFINSGIPHAFSRGEEAASSQCSIVFDPSIVGGRMDSVFWQRYVQPVLNAAAIPWQHLTKAEDWQQETVRAVQSAWEDCRTEAPDYELSVRNSLTVLLMQLERHRPGEHPQQNRRILRDNERIRNMMDYIQLHFSQPLTVSDIADSAVISVSECLRCFHNTIGMTPIQCLKHYRVQQAASRLVHTDQKISQIASDCGFQEMSYFAKAFREIMGLTPSQYRKTKAQP